MKAMVIDKFGAVETLHLAEIPSPKPAKTEVQIQIAYAGVNPVDWKILEGMKAQLPHAFPLIPGWDAAGKILAVGSTVKNFKIGDEVFTYCRQSTVQWGTYAEFVSVEAANVAYKPKTLSFAEAAVIPLAGLTAWQALFDKAQLKKGDTILIHAGAGGVGGFAIQFAKSAGAHIITTASQENQAYVKSLGADRIIDYHQANFAIEVKKLFPRGIDVVFDTVGGKTFLDSLDLLKSQGRIVSTLEKLDPKVAESKGIQAFYFFVAPSGLQLQQIAALIEQGKVIAPSIEEIPLVDAVKALQRSKEGHIQGKLVLKV